MSKPDRLEPDSETPLYVRNDMALQNGIIALRDEMRPAMSELLERVVALEAETVRLKAMIAIAATTGRGTGPTA